MRKIIILVLVFILAFAFTTTAFAASDVEKPEPGGKSQVWGYISANTLSFRSAPGLSSTVYGNLYKYDVVYWYTPVNNQYADGLWWRNIYSYDRYYRWGWSWLDYIRTS